MRARSPWPCATVTVKVSREGRAPISWLGRPKAVVPAFAGTTICPFKVFLVERNSPSRIMRRVWSERIIATFLFAAAGCAALHASDEGLERRVTGALERGGLGADALAVIDNVVRHGAPPPRLAPAVVREVLARPLGSADAAALFRRAVPAELTLEPAAGQGGFETLLKTYLEELAEAQAQLRAAVRPFDDAGLLRTLAEGLPSAGDLLALADRVDAAALERANLRFMAATMRFANGMRAVRDFPAARTFQSSIGAVIIGTRG